MDIQSLDKDAQIALLTKQVSDLMLMAQQSSALEKKLSDATTVTAKKLEDAIKHQKENEEDAALVIAERDDLKKKYAEAKQEIVRLNGEVDILSQKLTQAQQENTAISKDIAQQKKQLQAEPLTSSYLLTFEQIQDSKKALAQLSNIDSLLRQENPTV
ncbi:hypothetical protein PROFUN_07194 [Planoprotostelium fungivorum]|uniref:Uncharacterized protein n=1 Tax=Planoprotostelium fungivorum TaxID=1890364 RepID=A0A2P6NME5_9EUKA|nr:hypothetical protein PROFUN_07194 [Planoprotostelium fungivorum]